MYIYHTPVARLINSGLTHSRNGSAHTHPLVPEPAAHTPPAPRASEPAPAPFVELAHFGVEPEDPAPPVNDL